MLEITQFISREDNPVVEIRAKIGGMTKWSNSHSRTARALYRLILETLNLVDDKMKKNPPNADTEKHNKRRQLSCVDVPVDINGRHEICDRARKKSSQTNTDSQTLPSNSCRGLCSSSGKKVNNGPPINTLYLIWKH